MEVLHKDGAGIVLHTRTGEQTKFLLYKRDDCAPNYKGYWALFGGQIDDEDGGDPRNTSVRELSEELAGITVAYGSLTALCCVQVTRNEVSPLIHYLSAELEQKLCELSLKGEGDGLGLFSNEEINHLLMRPEDRMAIERFLQGTNFRLIESCSVCAAAGD